MADFLGRFQGWIVAFLLLGGGAAGIIFALQVMADFLDRHWQLGPAPWDAVTLRWCQDHYHPRLHRWAADLTALGSTFVLSLVVILVATALLLAGHFRLAVFVLTTSLGASGLIISVKDMVERPRPPAALRLDPFVGDSFSFPSGHALGAMAIYGNLAWLLVRLAPNRRTARFILVAALALAFGIGLTRIYLRVHYPTDVMAGWLAGLTWMAVTILAVRLIPPAGYSPAGNTAKPRESS